MANINGRYLGDTTEDNLLILKVAIPCSGHASLIIDELKKIEGVDEVIFKQPNAFEIKYKPNKLKEDNILKIEIFNQFKAIKKIKHE